MPRTADVCAILALIYVLPTHEPYSISVDDLKYSCGALSCHGARPQSYLWMAHVATIYVLSCGHPTYASTICVVIVCVEICLSAHHAMAQRVLYAPRHGMAQRDFLICELTVISCLEVSVPIACVLMAVYGPICGLTSIFKAYGLRHGVAPIF